MARRFVLVASSNALGALGVGVRILQGGGCALDAVEAVIRQVESDPADNSVGRGGLPNLHGVVELDASIMDGRTLAAGAVAAVRGFEHPITIARLVMERLPHVLLVQEGAERFARDCGLEPTDLTTPASRQAYAAVLRRVGTGPARTSAQWVADLAADHRSPQRPPDVGTVDVLALDAHGRLASGVSTSGLPWKLPGRVGDSAIIGAGNYCDGRWGAAACTGWGELAIRTAAACSLVREVGAGRSPQQAGEAVMRRVAELPEAGSAPLHCLVLTVGGAHAGFSFEPTATYAVADEEDPRPRLLPRTSVALPASGQPHRTNRVDGEGTR